MKNAEKSAFFPIFIELRRQERNRRLLFQRGYRDECRLHVDGEASVGISGDVVVFDVVEGVEAFDAAAQAGDYGAAYLGLRQVGSRALRSAEHLVDGGVSALHLLHAPFVVFHFGSRRRSVEVYAGASLAEHESVQSLLAAVHAVGASVDVGEEYLLMVWVYHYGAPYVAAHEEDVEELLVEAMEVKLVAALLRGVDHENVAVEHLRKLVYKRLHRREDVGVHLDLQIVGIAVFPHETVAYLDEDGRRGIAQLRESALVAEEVFAVYSCGHSHQGAVSLVDARVVERRSEKGEYVAEEYGVGAAVVLYYLGDVDEMESRKLKLLEDRAVMAAYGLVDLCIEFVFHINGRSDVDVEARPGE